MTELDKVVKGLKICFRNKNCDGCPYETDCKKAANTKTDWRCPILDDVLELLKKQNELIEQYDKWADGKITLCRDCKFLHGCKIFNIHGEDENWFCADGIRR